ncbi:MAG TPA: BrnT family toxin [Longilinea sp.]|nr:BrnT family toxin [Longilinea sp.]
MTYEWDYQKAHSNRLKHGIDFADAVTVLEDEYALTIEEDDYIELRYITVGVDAMGRVLVVVYTYRRDVIRMISARKATPRERQQYEENR